MMTPAIAAQDAAYPRRIEVSLTPLGAVRLRVDGMVKLYADLDYAYRIGGGLMRPEWDPPDPAWRCDPRRPI